MIKVICDKCGLSSPDVVDIQSVSLEINGQAFRLDLCATDRSPLLASLQNLANTPPSFAMFKAQEAAKSALQGSL